MEYASLTSSTHSLLHGIWTAAWSKMYSSQRPEPIWSGSFSQGLRYSRCQRRWHHKLALPGAKFVLETVPPVGDPRVDCLDPAFLLARCAMATFSSTARLNGCASTTAPSLLVANSLRPRSMSTDSLNRASYRVGWCLGVAYQRPRASSLMLAKSRWRSSGRNCPKPATTLCHTRSSYGHRQCQTP